MGKEKRDQAPCFNVAVNKTTDALDINLNTDIGFWGTDAEDFDNILKGNSERELDVKINSDGGSISAGISILNAMKAHQSPVNIIITGIAASISGVIAMGSEKKPKMYQNTIFMMHPPAIPSGGTVKEMSDKIEVLNKWEEAIVSAYMRHFNGTEDVLRAMIAKTTYLTATEAEEVGLAEVIPEDVNITNFLDCTAYNYAPIPEHIKEIYKNKEVKSTLDNIKDIVSDLLNSNPKEPLGMGTKENEIEIGKLEGENKTLSATNLAHETKISALDVENKDLKKQISDRKEADAVNAAAVIEKDVDSFLAKCVTDGKLLPVNVETEKSILLALAKVDNDELNLVFAQKAKLEGSEKVVNLSPEEIAKNGKGKVDDNALDTATKKYMVENKGASYGDAVVQVLNLNPELDNGEN